MYTHMYMYAYVHLFHTQQRKCTHTYVRMYVYLDAHLVHTQQRKCQVVGMNWWRAVPITFLLFPTLQGCLVEHVCPPSTRGQSYGELGWLLLHLNLHPPLVSPQQTSSHAADTTNTLTCVHAYMRMYIYSRSWIVCTLKGSKSSIHYQRYLLPKGPYSGNA